MSKSEEDRQALLEKIRLDMAESRKRLAAMRERKASVSMEQAPTIVNTSESAQNKFAAASSSIMDKLKAEREAKKKQTAAVPVTGEKKDIVVVKKKADGTEEKVIKTVDVAEDGTLLTDGKVIKVRKASVVTPPPQIVIDPVPESTNTANTASTRKRKPPSGKNIRSLADLQKAIKKADQVKQKAKTQGKIGELRRERDTRRKKQMTREERRAYRQSKRLTVELQHSENRVKVDQQITKFMAMIQTLEGEWQKGEEDRVKREKEMEEQRSLFDKATNQMEFLTSAMNEMAEQMNVMKIDLDNLVTSASKGIKKEEKWYNSQFLSFQNNFLDMRHQAQVSSAKQKKMQSQTQKEAEKIAQDLKLPPPPLPTTTKAGGGSVNPITNLLAQIRTGTSLKKLDPEQVEKERSERKGNWRQSVQLLQGLQDTLRDALDQRHLALFSDEEEDEDEYDDEDWE